MRGPWWGVWDDATARAADALVTSMVGYCKDCGSVRAVEEPRVHAYSTVSGMPDTYTTVARCPRRRWWYASSCKPMDIHVVYGMLAGKTKGT